MRSIVQFDRECWACRELYGIRTIINLEEHHIYPGNPRRELSERCGLKVWLCNKHHTKPPLGVHCNPPLMDELQRAGQRAYERTHSRADFVMLFGKNYLEDEDA